MAKLFRNYLFNIFIATVFFLSQIVNVHANSLSNVVQQEEVSVIEQVKEKVTHITAFYAPSLNYEAINDTTAEGKVEKVIEPITLTLGTFGIAALAGYATTIVGMLLGWMVKGLMRYFQPSK
ncbi:hypothetical protein [Bartonella machadoae]|uniref:hypothetical protein n=1 Tax=Bartonella machadoae TaxID=2893471 RepID=UPI001F4CE3BA|nr:hypothetical protein [Bartonella machadoae]UNE54891.1 hypothetical protein LNM86_03255 [Bartonella machadoae]